jgi:hypothetical protein
MVVRYHWGLGIGHVYAHCPMFSGTAQPDASSPEPNAESNQEILSNEEGFTSDLDLAEEEELDWSDVEEDGENIEDDVDPEDDIDDEEFIVMEEIYRI